MNEFFNDYYADTSLIPCDIYPMQYGEEQCFKNHSFGPCIRNNYIIHYIYSGKGSFCVNGREYELHAGQLFLICPDILTFYKADSKEPWMYRWIEFNGSFAGTLLKSAALNAKEPVLNDREGTPIGNALLDIVHGGSMSFELLMCKFWNFIYALTDGSSSSQQNPSGEYIRQAEAYIKMNIYKKVTVNDVAAYVGIDRSYLSRLFQKHRDMSPQQFIISLKLNMASQYLRNQNISVAEAAQSVGYSDPHVFAKAFKKQFSLSPGAWQKQIMWEQSIKSL